MGETAPIPTEVKWLAPPLLVGVAVHVAYFLTHPYPAFGAGLFSVTAEQVIRAEYALPERIPYYTGRGVPFAYPPLMFYVTALLHDALGVSFRTLGRVLPGVFTVAYLVPLYLFAAEVLGSNRQASLGAVIAASSPPILQWHLSAGGLVRAPAALFTLCGLYTGLELFTRGGRRWVLASLGFFALTVLTHPVYTVFFVLSYLWMFVYFGPTPAGLRDGAIVGVGGLAIAFPWWGQVVAVHGPDVFIAAAGTHGGIGKQLPKLVALLSAGPGGAQRSGVLFSVSPDLFDFRSVGMLVLSVWSLALIASAGYLIATRRRFLPAWGALAVLFVSKPRFSFLIGALMCAAVAFELHWLARRRCRLPSLRRYGGPVLIALLVAATVTTGVLYAGSQLDTHAGSTSLPRFIDDDDVRAMEWVARHTDPSAGFVVVGDAAEWFPLYTHRTILVGPWGIEWEGQRRYQYQLGLYNRISTCESKHCIEKHLAASGTNPEYIYLPTEEYTVRGMKKARSDRLLREFVRSDQYEVVFRNEGVMVVRVHGQPIPWSDRG